MSSVLKLLMGENETLDEALTEGARQARMAHAGDRLMYHLRTNDLGDVPNFEDLTEHDAFFDVNFQLVQVWSWKHAKWSRTHMSVLFESIGSYVADLPTVRYADAADQLRRAMNLGAAIQGRKT